MYFVLFVKRHFNFALHSHPHLLPSSSNIIDCVQPPIYLIQNKYTAFVLYLYMNFKTILWFGWFVGTLHGFITPLRISNARGNVAIQLINVQWCKHHYQRRIRWRLQNNDYENQLLARFTYCDDCSCQSSTTSSMPHNTSSMPHNCTTTIQRPDATISNTTSLHLIHPGPQGNHPIMFPMYYAAYDIPCEGDECELVDDSPIVHLPKTKDPADTTLEKMRKTDPLTTYDYAIGYDARDPNKCDFSPTLRNQNWKQLASLCEFFHKQRILDILENETLPLDQRLHLAKQMLPPDTPTAPNVWKGLEFDLDLEDWTADKSA